MVDTERVLFSTAPKPTAPQGVSCGTLPTCGRTFQRPEDITPRDCMQCMQAYIKHQELCLAEALQALADVCGDNNVRLKVAQAIRKIHAIKQVVPS